uniref:MADF domain-containing protein n=1 Tax=Anopheles minimus TaxID=112268 RepID=A0A182VZ77_9DIPT
MSASSQRQILTEFIQLYKSFPCLWDSTAKEYLDRGEKKKAYDRLVQKYQEIDNNANRNTVAKKINVLRTCYRRELSKLNNRGDNVNKPTLWYFDLLSFLDKANSREFESSFVNYDIYTSCADKPIKGMLQHVEIEYIEDESTVDNNDCASILEKRVYSSCSTSSTATTGKRKFYSLDHDPNSTRQRSILAANGEDSFDIFGKHVAYKLQSLTKQQYTLAQKLINDVLFEGEMETLNRRCGIINRKSKIERDLE